MASVFDDVFGGLFGDGDTFAKARSPKGGGSGMPGPPKGDPEALDYDPYDELIYNNFNDATNGRGLNYEVRRGMASAPQIAPAISLRINQASKFTREPRDRYGFGVAIETREVRKSPSPGELKEIARLQRYVETCGVLDTDDPDSAFKRDSFCTFVKKTCRDSLIHDAMTFEVIEDRLGKPSWFQAVDATTIRRWEVGGGDRPGVDYVQWIRDQERAAWPARKLAFGVRRPRTDIRCNGYGFPELDELFIVVTGLLNSLDYNMNYFKQGSTTKGILKIVGNVPAKQLRAFKRFWATMVSGLHNSWRTPIINVPEKGGDVNWIGMGQSNRDMEWSMFNEFLMWLAFFHFGIDGVEAGIKYGGAGGQKSMFESDNEARLRLSRERGLEPMMLTLEDLLNKHVIWRINPDFRLSFKGLSSLSEKERVDLDAKRVMTSVTFNELRDEDNRDAVEGGDIIGNQVYTQYLAAQAQQKQQEAALKAQQGGAGGEDQPEKPPAAAGEPAGDDDIPDDEYDEDGYGALFKSTAPFRRRGAAPFTLRVAA